jgi:hypothetical protein
VILVGVGIASGEYIVWPYISSQVAALLIVINRRFMPEPLKIRGVRLAVLAFAFCLFGVMSVLVVINEAAG